MAIRTQIRTTQLTGSLGTAAGQITDQLSAIASGSFSASELTDVFSALASASKRITGADSFTEQAAGVFTHAVVDLSGDIRVRGDNILNSGGANALTFDADATNVAVTLAAGSGLTSTAGDLKVTGNDIQASDGVATLTMSGRDLSVAGDLTVTGNDIKGSGGTVITMDGSNNATFANDVNVNGGDLVVKGVNDAGATLNLQADNNDDNGDAWIVGANANQSLGVLNNISGAPVAMFSIVPNATATDSVANVAGKLKVSGLVIQNADGEDCITIDADQNASIAADLTVLGGKVTLTNGAIIDSETAGKIKLTEDLVECSADLTVLGNDLDFAAANAQIGATVGANILSLGGATSTVAALNDLRVDGNILADANEAKAIFAAVTSNAITLGGGGDVVCGGDLQVNGTSIDVDSASALTIGATVGANDITVGASTSTIVIPGNLTVDGKKTILNVNEIAVEDKLIAMGIPGGMVNATYTVSANVVTVVSSGHGLSNSEYVLIADPADTEVITEGVYQITSVADANTFTFAFTTGNNASATAISHSANNVTNATATGSGILVSPASTTEHSIKWQPTGWTVSGAALSGSWNPGADNSADLGRSGAQWKDLYVNGIGYIDQLGTDADPSAAYISSGEIDGAVIGGESAANGTFLVLTANTSILPDANDGAPLGAAGTAFSDLFLAEGAVINWDSGDFTLTQAGNLLTVAGGELRMDGAQKVEFGGNANWIQLDTDLKIIAAADILMDAAGSDVKFQSVGLNPFQQLNRAGAGESYINFSTNDGAGLTGGSGGFGFRNNAGSMQFKNNGGSWTTFSGDEVTESKTVAAVAAQIAAGTRVFGAGNGFDVSEIGSSTNDRVDIYVNGQLLVSSSLVTGNGDYALDAGLSGAADCDVKMQFVLEPDDVVNAIVR